MADNPNCLSSTPFTGIPMVPDTGYPIHIGDLLFQDPNTKKARSVASMINQGSKTLNQQTLHDIFAGVALQRGGELESGEVSFNLNPLPPQLIVAGGGMFLFGCAATAWQPGDWVGAAANTAGTGLQTQTVEKVSALSNAIGIAVPLPNAIGQSRTTVAVRILSSLLGGVPTLAPGSSSGTV
jgi:hypothetical protein